MITMAAFAILGAALGLFVRPRCWAWRCRSCWPCMIEGGATGLIGVMEHQPNRELLVDRLRGDLRRNWVGAVGPIAAAVDRRGRWPP
jgi:hypothetical protein